MGKWVCMELRTQVAERWEKQVMGPHKMEQVSQVLSLGRTRRATSQGTLLMHLGRTQGWFPWENGIRGYWGWGLQW